MVPRLRGESMSRIVCVERSSHTASLSALVCRDCTIWLCHVCFEPSPGGHCHVSSYNGHNIAWTLFLKIIPGMCILTVCPCKTTVLITLYSSAAHDRFFEFGKLRDSETNRDCWGPLQAGATQCNIYCIHIYIGSMYLYILYKYDPRFIVAAIFIEHGRSRAGSV